MLKIGLFTDSFTPMIDGVAMVVKNYAEQLSKKQVSVTVVAPACKGSKPESFEVLRFPSLTFFLRKSYRTAMPFSNVIFYNKLKNINFDIIHAHSPFHSGQLALRLAKERNIPLVATFHSKFKQNIEQISHNGFFVDLAMKKIIRFFEQADEVWLPLASAEQTIRDYGFKGKSAIMENGCDFVPVQISENEKNTLKKSLGLDNDEMLFLYVGQIILEKNIMLIINALEKIKYLKFKMFFVGAGYAEKELKRAAKNLNISDKCVFCGLIPDREMLKKYYSAADLMLFPSLYDTFAIVVREAAAFGVPSVMIDGATAASVIDDSFNGFLAENSVNSFAEKIAELYFDREKIKSAGTNARETLVQSWETVIEKVLERYKTMLLN